MQYGLGDKEDTDCQVVCLCDKWVLRLMFGRKHKRRNECMREIGESGICGK